MVIDDTRDKEGSIAFSSVNSSGVVLRCCDDRLSSSSEPYDFNKLRLLAICESIFEVYLKIKKIF